jgi:hypothetical protein
LYDLLTPTLLSEICRQLLAWMAEEQRVTTPEVGVAENGLFM